MLSKVYFKVGNYSLFPVFMSKAVPSDRKKCEMNSEP